MPSRTSLRAALSAVAWTTLLLPSVARADDDASGPVDYATSVGEAGPTDEGEVPSPPFRYRSPRSSAPARALLEELLVLGVGYVEYVADKDANTRDFDLNFDWPSLRSKLLFQSLAFDDNHFPTNWVTHPIAGYFYYGVARANRLSIGESFLLSAAASTLWEVFGEWREQASVNDLVVTPMTGAVVGESFFQLGALFQRSRPTFATTGLSWLFGSLKNANDFLDGAEVARSDRFDGLGLPDDEWHRFRLSAGTGATWQDHGSAYLDGRLEAASRVVTLPDYRRDGTHHRWFDSGEITSLSVGVTMWGGGVADFLFASEVMPFGYYDHEVRGAEGHTTVTGLRLAFDYGLHDQDRDGRRGLDRVATAGAGLGLEHAVQVGSFELEAGFDALASFAGVDAYALPEYERVHATEGLSSVLANESYYHAVGLTMRPTVRLAVGRLDTGIALRFDSFTAIEALDRNASTSAVITAADQRTIARAWLGVAPTDHVRLELSGTRRAREGRVGEVSSERGETGLVGGVDVLF